MILFLHGSGERGTDGLLQTEVGGQGPPGIHSGPPYPVIGGRIRALPIWIWHGDADGVVPVEESRRMAEALRADGRRVTYTELPGVGHEAWTPAFDSPELSRWLLAQKRQTRS